MRGSGLLIKYNKPNKPKNEKSEYPSSQSLQLQWLEYSMPLRSRCKEV